MKHLNSIFTRINNQVFDLILSDYQFDVKEENVNFAREIISKLTMVPIVVCSRDGVIELQCLLWLKEGITIVIKDEIELITSFKYCKELPRDVNKIAEEVNRHFEENEL